MAKPHKSEGAQNRPARAVSGRFLNLVSFGTSWAEAQLERKNTEGAECKVFLDSQSIPFFVCSLFCERSSFGFFHYISQISNVPEKVGEK